MGHDDFAMVPPALEISRRLLRCPPSNESGAIIVKFLYGNASDLMTISATTPERLSLPLWQERYAWPHLPMSRAEMEARGWSEVDIVCVTGDAYVDHPSFAMAILGRVLESAGFRVAMLSQPAWQSCEPW